MSVLTKVVRFGECFGERIGFCGTGGELDGADERLDGQPRLFVEVNQVVKERVPEWQSFLNICTCANGGPKLGRV